MRISGLVRSVTPYRLGVGCTLRARFSTHTSKGTFLKISDEIQEALHSKKPVVALETTIYTHGFPYPQNTALASHLESVVRAHGGIPATIGVLNGVARVGLNAEELIELTASAAKPDTRKGISGRKLNGGTTIAGTMVLAHLAGIRIFATGGLGGVHRGGEDSMDISADLTELGRTPVTVISSGCKSFLDIPRTLEYLETQGVGVGTFADGREGKVDFPAFWTRESGIPSPTVIRSEQEAAAITRKSTSSGIDQDLIRLWCVDAQAALGLSSGLHFANPVPARYSIPRSKMDAIISQAVSDAQKLGATGSDNTPFVLARIRELTDGQSITANRALIEANVMRGTKVACELAKLQASPVDIPDRSQALQPGRTSIQNENGPHVQSASPGWENAGNLTMQGQPVEVFVAGSLAIDLSCNFTPPKGPQSSSSSLPKPRTSNPAQILQSLGGVGQNVATTLHQLGTNVQLCSRIGGDDAAASVKKMLLAKGLSLSGIIEKSSGRTAQYVAVNDAQKNLVLAMADMDILQGCQSELDAVWKPCLDRHRPKWLVVDACWDADTLRKWIKYGKAANAKIAFEPVSVAKSRSLFAPGFDDSLDLGVLPNHMVSLATPNSLELASMHAAARETGWFERDDWWKVIDALGLSSSGSRDKLVSMTNASLVDEGIPQQSIQLLPFIPTVLTKLGEKGVLMTQVLRPGDDRLTSPTHARHILARAEINHHTIGGVYMRMFPPAEQVPARDVVSVNGIGDTFLGVIVAGLTKESPKILIDLIHVAQKGSVMTLKSNESVSPEINKLQKLL
ncbi:MAG: hypothetical protein LQ345_002393 [Seirophora villosa]|nr:MAG: hypothetical protein LQ345_002393 [Seirophora villosa]